MGDVSGVHGNREWVRKAVRRDGEVGTPYNFSFSPPARKAVEERCGVDSVEDAFDFPIRMASPKSVKPLYASPEEFGETATDEFGVIWTTSEVDRGSPVGPPLTEPDLSGYRFPDASAGYRFGDLEQFCGDNRGNYTIVWVGDLWERATFMRGMQEILLDLAFNGRFVEGLLDGIADYVIETMGILFERFGFDCVALSDDYGTQKSLLMSPSDWRRFVKPRLSRIYEFAKSRGADVFHHSCGNVGAIVGDMIDIGLDILHPIQPEAMDIGALKREFGGKVAFCGGIRTQDLLPRGTVEEVRGEVRRLREEMGKGGGYILEPGITIQCDVPVENILAMMEEARGGIGEVRG